jgi:hypothetical protein
MGGCCESRLRGSPSERYFSAVDFSFKDVVPIKYHHYIKEYEFEKNLPSIKDRTSKLNSDD